ncbi:hypothetical protein PP175_26085 (plasmid) [Aneurinibacillus sp. Ricciae_BoGa-3]|uniref:hypothetical protein n=1 Tax=Aneurinibacillus sp. Ricciae_BoGa-3 TaxID=3022697 RepID=UPI002340B5F0|nr:hypothetical protein [Aneurinibacillus sp. Ricciae_BoGa-3]WCK57537.1 hypothetical protein PP175_26085 [Aneurinibacillus sp. Ricciae_BoGa-3]
MAQVQISQHPLMKWGEEIVGAPKPKPKKYQRRIVVTIPDDVAKAKEVQPVLDAYALAVKKPEWVGKNMAWYEQEQLLSLGFYMLSFDDGTPIN